MENLSLSNRPFIPLEGFAYAMKIAELCYLIQAKGIATTFCDMSGHVAKIYVAAHAPQWLDFKPENRREAMYSGSARYDSIDDGYYDESRNKLARDLVWILENRCVPGQWLPVRMVDYKIGMPTLFDLV